MKNLSLLLALTFIITSLFSCAAPRDTANVTPINTSGEYIINEKPLTAVAEKQAKFTFDSGLPGFCFVFSIPAEQYSHIVSECTNLEITASVFDGDGNEYPSGVIDYGNKFGMWQFGVSVGGLFKKDYLTSYRSSLTLSFTDKSGKSRTHSATSDAVTLYDVAYSEYCDRNAMQSDLYPYAYGSDYSPYPDLSHHYAVLCGILHLTISGGAVNETYANSTYQSPYNVAYFDEVLTVSMKNGMPMDADFLEEIFVNGENIYFEIYDGIIRVLLEVK